MADYRKLQNGSDIRGVALEGIPGEPVTLTPAIAQEIARAFVCWLSSKNHKTPQATAIGVGWDSRLSGPQLASGVTAGLSQEGATCFTCGLSSTPAMFMSTILPGFGWDGAIMITASHLPWNRNGLKFFTRDGGLDKEDIQAILSLAESLPPSTTQPKPPISCPQLMDAYATHLRATIAGGLDAAEDDLPLAGYKIAVDCGGGAGGFFAHKVLVPLGADISASRFLEPDGYFKGHVPNPENQEAMVTEGHCHLGIIFDTDVDRVGAVLASGQELCRNRFIGLTASIIASEAPGSTIVTDNVTSSQLTDFIQNTLGCVHHRFKRGYKNIINEAKRLNQIGHNCPLAMETSGHSALRLSSSSKWCVWVPRVRRWKIFCPGLTSPWRPRSTASGSSAQTLPTRGTACWQGCKILRQTTSIGRLRQTTATASVVPSPGIGGGSCFASLSTTPSCL